MEGLLAALQFIIATCNGDFSNSFYRAPNGVIVY